jgi:hypothetical protein
MATNRSEDLERDDTFPQSPSDDVEVVLIARWRVPRKLAEPWVEHVNNVWNTQKFSRPTATLNATMNAPGGFHPEIKLEIGHD